MEFGRKRGNPNGGFVGNGGFKKSKHETESFASGIGSKSKPCMKFFSTSGCSFGEGCHFLHYVPGGYSAVAHVTNQGGNHSFPPAGRNSMAPQPFSDGPTPTVKTKLCNKFNTAEGCRFGEKCHFAHGDWELGKPSMPAYEDPRGRGPNMSRLSGRAEPPQPGLAAAANFGASAAANFGASAAAKISIDASLAGAIIGKGGVNSKQICRDTGVKLSIKDHDTNPNEKNIELEGTFDQIKHASAMVSELIMNLGAAYPPAKPTLAAPAGNFKTKVCENFTKGTCTFGERCHFAHGPGELRKTVV